MKRNYSQKPTRYDQVKLYKSHLRNLEEIYSSQKNVKKLKHEIDKKNRFRKSCHMSSSLIKSEKMKKVQRDNQLLCGRINKIQRGDYKTPVHRVNSKKTLKKSSNMSGTWVMLEKARIASENIRLCNRIGKIKSDLNKNYLYNSTKRFTVVKPKKKKLVVRKVKLPPVLKSRIHSYLQDNKKGMISERAEFGYSDSILMTRNEELSRSRTMRQSYRQIERAGSGNDKDGGNKDLKRSIKDGGFVQKSHRTLKKPVKKIVRGSVKGGGKKRNVKRKVGERSLKQVKDFQGGDKGDGARKMHTEQPEGEETSRREEGGDDLEDNQGGDDKDNLEEEGELNNDEEHMRTEENQETNPNEVEDGKKSLSVSGNMEEQNTPDYNEPTVKTKLEEEGVLGDPGRLDPNLTNTETEERGGSKDTEGQQGDKTEGEAKESDTFGEPLRKVAEITEEKKLPTGGTENQEQQQQGEVSHEGTEEEATSFHTNNSEDYILSLKIISKESHKLTNLQVVIFVSSEEEVYHVEYDREYNLEFRDYKDIEVRANKPNSKSAEFALMFYNEETQKEIASLNREIDLNNILEVEIQMGPKKKNTVYVQITRADFGDTEGQTTENNFNVETNRRQAEAEEEYSKDEEADDDDLDVENDILDDDDF